MIELQRATIFTIVSRNYAAQARVLMDSLALYEPDADRLVVVSDGVLTSEEVGGALVVCAEDLAVSAPLRAMSTYYDALEFNTAIKPFCFKALLEKAQLVVYLDPDIQLFGNLRPVWEGFDQANLLLTPHLLRPLDEDGRPNSTDILKSGTYNLGFMGLQRSAEAMAFASWWAERCRFDCRVDFEVGLFTDQRWVDLAPSFVETTRILRDPGLNVAYWNLAERPLGKQGAEWLVDGVPLRFFHFSGFNPARSDLLSKHQDRLKVVPRSPLSNLLKGYARSMTQAGSAAAAARPYAFSTFPDGKPVTAKMRRAFLQAARSGRDLTDGLSRRQAEWIHGLAPESLASAEPRTRGGDDWQAAGELVHRASPAQADPPWLGKASEAAHWLLEEGPEGELPRAISAFRRARNDVSSIAPDPKGADRRLLMALCIGHEAASGRFSVETLPKSTLVALAKDEALLEAARLWRPTVQMTDLVSGVVARYALASAADWPAELMLGRLATLDAPALAIWNERPDLQAAFDLRRLSDRLRLYRWVAKVGVREYGLDAASLPALYRASGISMQAKAGSPPAPRRSESAAILVCMPRRLAPGAALPSWLKASDEPLSLPGALPRRVETCVHYGELAEAVLGWMVMQRNQVHVTTHVWAPAIASATPAPNDSAWSFVDRVWRAQPSRFDHPRPSVAPSEPVAHQLLRV